MRKGKRFIAIALSVAMMLPYASSAGTIDASAAEADDQQVTATSTDAGEYSEPEEIELAADDEAEPEVEETFDVQEAAAKEDLTALKAGTVTVSATYFPNEYFRATIKTQLGLADDAVLTEEKAKSLTSLDVSGSDYNDLTGLGYFTELTELKCKGNGLTSLDVSNLTKLTYLDCSYNALSSLDLSKNTELEKLYCGNNGSYFKTLNIEANKKLTILSCPNNGLDSLAISSAKDLVYLDCSNNSILTLDVGACTALTYLDCSITAISSLSLVNNTVLDTLICNDTNITTLDLSNHTALKGVFAGYTSLNKNSKYLTAQKLTEDTFTTNYGTKALLTDASYGGKLTKLDLSGCTSLAEVYCDNNSLSEIKLDGDTALTKLRCNSNKLASLDVTGNTALEDLQCNSNSLTTLDVTKNTALKILFASSNAIENTIDVSKNTALQVLLCNNNKLTSIDVSKIAASLLELNCNYNSLDKLGFSKTLSGNVDYALTYLFCDNNYLTSLNISDTNVTKSTDFSCSKNEYNIASMNEFYEIELQNLPGNPTGMASNTTYGIEKFNSGAYYYNDASRLIPSLGATQAVYKYVVGHGLSTTFTIKFDAINIDVLLDTSTASVSDSSTSIAQKLFIGDKITCSAVNKANHAELIKNVTWSSENVEVATIDKDTGELTGIAPGTAKIYVYVNGNARGYINVQIRKAVTGITLKADDQELKSTDTIELELGNNAATDKKSKQITATASPDNATEKGVTFASSDTNIVAVTYRDNVCTITPKKAGTAVITATAADGSGVKTTFNVHVKQLANSIKITQGTSTSAKTEVTVTEGASVTLKGTPQPTTADPAVTWSSEDTSVATVSADGVVTGVASGETNIVCTDVEDSSIKASVKVTVVNGVKGIGITGDTNTLYLGVTSNSTGSKTVKLTANLTPSDPADSTVNWTSSDANVASVSSKTGATITVTGKKAGTATITATSKSNPDVSATYVVTVKQYVTSISITSATSRTVYTGQTLQLGATVGPDAAFNKNVTWTSDDTKIATVDQNGKVKGVKSGSVTIRCTAKDGSGKTTTTTVTVKQSVTGIALASTTTTTVFVGKSITLKATLSPTNPKPATTAVTWTSSNKKVATVSSSGVVTAKKKGTVKITCKATDGSGKSKTIKITVKKAVKKPVTSIKLNKTSVTLKKGKKVTLKATLSPAKPTSKKVIWKTSDSSIATVSSKGKVTAKKKGTVTITCVANDGSNVYTTCTITVK